MMSEIEIFGTIGTDVTAPQIKAQLAAADQDKMLTVRIDSPGGSVFAGNAIHSALVAYQGPKRAIVESFAGSIASYILTAFDDVEMTENGYVMIHNPSMELFGDDEDHTRAAELLSEIKQQMVKAYAQKMRKDETKVAEMMKAETHFNATKAVQSGLATSVTARNQPTRIPVNCFDSMPFKVVACLRSAGGDSSLPTEKPMAQQNEPVAASVKEIRAAFPNLSSDFVLGCVEKSLPMAEVAVAAAEAMENKLESLQAENDEMRAKLEAMEKEATEAKATADAEAKATADAQAAASANQPVANASNSTGKTARVRWNEAVQACVSEGMSKYKAVASANRRHPGLRAEMLAEANT